MLECGNKIAFYDAKYESIGPEFEVYLAKDDGVAFNATGSAGTVTAVHISIRSANGGTISPQVYNGSNKAWEPITVAYNTDRTEQYYDVTKYATSNGGNIYIRNAGSGIMSIINVKVVGGSAPKVNTRMMMDVLSLFQGEAETPAVDDGVKLYHSLNLASDISVNYLIPTGSPAPPDLPKQHWYCRRSLFLCPSGNCGEALSFPHLQGHLYGMP